MFVCSVVLHLQLFTTTIPAKQNSRFPTQTSSYLRFGQIQLPRELGALAAHDVLAPLELELEPVQLLGREGGPRALGPVQVEALGQHDLPDGAFGVWPEEEEKTNINISEQMLQTPEAIMIHWHVE